MASEEEIWKKRLLEEDVTPPDSVWAAIEAELDQTKKKRFVVWLPWYSVGGLAAALLLIGFGVWVGLIQPVDTPKSMVSRTSPNSSHVISSANQSPKEELAELGVQLSQTKRPSVRRHADVHKEHSWMDPTAQPLVNLENFVAMDVTSTSPIGEEVSFLSPRSFMPMANRFQWNRPRLAVPEFDPEKKSSRQSKTRFLALQSHAAPFAPGVQWPGMAQQAFAAVRETVQNDQPLFTTSSGRFPDGILSEGDRTISSLYDPNAWEPEQRFARGWAVQMAAQAGIQLSEQWGVEIGLRYVQGTNSTESNVFTWEGQEMSLQTFFESSVLRQSKAESSLIGPKETTDTRYHWLSIPVQGVYSIPIGSKWNAAGSVGLSVDKLISNRWSSFATEQNYTPSNSAYRPLALSAVAGLRVSRALSNQWALVGGIFGQHSLSSWISESSVRMNPTQIGGQMGLSYQF